MLNDIGILHVVIGTNHSCPISDSIQCVVLNSIHDSIRSIRILYLDLSHCAHGAAWLPAISAMVLSLYSLFGLHLLPSPSARGGVAMSSSLYAPPPVYSFLSFLFFSLTQKERTKKNHVPVLSP
jgi:hypothetical protein